MVNIPLSDEGDADLPPTPSTQFDNYTVSSSDTTGLNETRPELRLLQNAVDLSIQNTKTYSFTLYASCTSYCWLFRIKSESL